MDVIRERLILHDLKKKSSNSKIMTKKRKFTLSERSEQGQVSERVHQDMQQDISGELDNDI